MTEKDVFLKFFEFTIKDMVFKRNYTNLKRYDIIGPNGAKITIFIKGPIYFNAQFHTLIDKYVPIDGLRMRSYIREWIPTNKHRWNG